MYNSFMYSHFQKQINDFLHSQACQCRNQFYEEVYDSIENEEDKKYYAYSSCIPALLLQPPQGDERYPRAYIRCTNYEPTSGFYCRNPHAQVNEVLRKRMEKLGELEFTVEGVSSLLKCEVDRD